MASREDRSWSYAEVEATVAAYLDMLLLELQGLPYNKAERRRALLPLLSGRSEGAVERKHQNISAVLIGMGVPYIDGYKPLGNYQELLADVVAQHVLANRALQAALARVTTAPPPVPTIDDILAALVTPPERQPTPRGTTVRERPIVRYASPADYLMREARNQALGAAGEEFVIRFEQARLAAARQERLSSQVEHVARTRGDGLGYDVLSFETDGRERLIEVKTTRFGQYTPFYVSRNEVDVSKSLAARYQLYRVFAFEKGPRMFALPGAIDSSCSLEPNSFVARLS